MFRKMRRAMQELPLEENIAILNRGKTGILACLGDEGYPYTVPVNYVYADGKIYFHCAKTGHKMDALRACDKACFTIIDRDDVVADEFTTYFKSVIAFGRVRILETPEEIMPAIRLLADRYSPDESDEKKQQEIDKEMPALAMLEFTVEHMTGKEAIELVRKRQKYE